MSNDPGNDGRSARQKAIDLLLEYVMPAHGDRDNSAKIGHARRCLDIAISDEIEAINADAWITVNDDDGQNPSAEAIFDERVKRDNLLRRHRLWLDLQREFGEGEVNP